MQPTGFRACEACRALKVRCMPADDGSALAGGSGSGSGCGTSSKGLHVPPATVLPPITQRSPCRRCQVTGATCIYTEPLRTKRKRTDVRVRELEREVRMLTEMLVLRRHATEDRPPAADCEVTEAEPATPRILPAAAETTYTDQTQPSVQPPLPGTPSALFNTSPASTGLLEPACSVLTHQPLQCHLASTPFAPLPLSPHPLVLLPSSRDPDSFAASSSADQSPHATSGPETTDPVAAGLLSMDKATRLFRRYVTVIAPQRPFVVFPKVTLAEGEDMTPAIETAITAIAALVREHRPVLFLSVLAAAVGSGLDDSYGGNDSSSAALSTALDAMLLRIYADHIVHQGVKSLELVQALIISANWNFYNFEPRSHAVAKPRSSANHGHNQPEKPAGSPIGSFDHLRCYQHMHMATTMAIELESLHLDSTSTHDVNMGEPVARNLLADPLAFERTLLACYICCSSISLGFHRQTMLSFTPVMAEYLRRLETSPHAAATDSIIAAWVHLQRIVDTAADRLQLRAVVRRPGGALATPSGNASHRYRDLPDLSNPSVQETLQHVTQRLEQWRSDHNRYMTNSLLIQYNTIVCLLHESCFYNEFDPADLKPPYRLSIPSRTACDAPTCHPLTPAHVASRRICLMAARSLIGLFLASPTEQLLGSPVVVYARVGYAILVLLKLQMSAALPGGAMRGILIDTATGDSATQVYQYLESLIVRLEQLKALGGRIAAVWTTMVRITHAWYEAYFLPAANGCPPQITRDAEFGAVLEPLRHCFSSDDDCEMQDDTHTRQRPSTLACSPQATRSPGEVEALSPGALGTDEIDRWMDPRVGLGDIQNQIFEFVAM
ncbi:hypothetical protein SEPCBS119000_004448 [Sporothrix epigloea]|uniref:Zn(2)-C6 fungal-type domain-containing protein n=1 Tax=Sporothrix epigloea TaxID=1892477 RepID=A0ABP0DTD0_9PEZI